MSQEAAGGGGMTEAIGAANEQLNEHVGRAIALEIRKANMVSMSAAVAAASAAQTKALYGDKDTPGYLSLRGSEAVDKFQDVIPNFKKNLDEIRDNLPNDDTRRMFGNEYDQMLDLANKQAHAHLAQQREIVAIDQVKDGVKVQSDLAARSVGTAFESDAIKLAKDTVAKTIIGYGVSHGDHIPGPNGEETDLPGEQTQAQLNKAMSDLNIGVLYAKQSNQDYMGAKRYYEANKDEIEPHQREVIEKAIEEGVVHVAGHNEAEAILKKYPGRGDTNADGTGGYKDEIAKIKDPKVREATNKLVQASYSQNERDVKARYDSEVAGPAYDAAQVGNPGPAEFKVPPSIWVGLDPADQKACDLLANPPKNSEHAAFIEFSQMKPVDMAKLSRWEFVSKYASKFSPSDRDGAAKLWQDSRKGADSPRLASTTAINKAAMSTFQNFGGVAAGKRHKDWSEDENASYVAFQKDLTDKVEEFNMNDLGGKRKATQPEIQKIAEDMMINSHKVESGMFSGDKTVPKYQNIDNLPEDEVSQIVKARKAKGLPVTDADILRMYNANHGQKRGK